ncbi:MAG: STAS domain-containing protein [Acidobacteriota bacterium]|nr:STAS domain-containing protein [Acidobacteriota bacterium]
MTAETSTRIIDSDITVIAISGRLSLGNFLVSLEASMRRAIEEGSRKLIVDLSGLDFMDSAGIGMLIGCNGLMDQKGGQFRIAGAHGVVARAFDIVHMSRITQLDPDVESACDHMRAGWQPGSA